MSKRPGESAHRPELPHLAIRVGITGARNLEAGQIERLKDQLEIALADIQQKMRSLAQEEDVVTHYADGKAATPVFRFLSPLAQGADRLAAQAALRLGYDLYVPMPFSPEEYEKDFQSPDGANLQEFRALLEKARGNWLSLDGDREDQDRAYEAVGQFVARHSDVLIAIWDGRAWERRGGTAQIVEYAAIHGVPVWWIHATEARAPRWLTNAEDLRGPRAPREDSSPLAMLQTYLESHMRPPTPVGRDRHGAIGKLARQGQNRHVSPIRDYYKESGRAPGRWSRLYGAVMRWASRCDLPWSDPVAPQDPVALYWFDLYRPADARASEYAARYRSTYVWLFVLATAVLAFATTAAVTHGHAGFSRLPAIVMTGGEILTLIIIGVFVCAAIRGDWHERFIEYRLLAELCRKQQVLAPLGRAVSLGAVRRMVLRQIEHATEAEKPAKHGVKDEARARSAWVAWLFAAWERAAPLPRGPISKTLRETAERHVIAGLIDDQLKYHAGRAEMSERADETFFHIGQQSFLAVGLVVAIKLAVQILAYFHPGWEELPGWEVFYQALTWLAIMLPAVSAAALGIRSYAELQLLAEQSRHMLEELSHAKRRIKRVNMDRALAAEDIGAEAQAVATLMLQDLDGWSRLFKVKAIEP
jgi:hypothetical protein